MKSSLRHAAAYVMRPLVFPGRYRLYKALSSVLGNEPPPFSVPLPCGHQLKINSPFWQHMFYLGDYERDVRIFLEHSVTRDSIVFDVGASIGIVTIPLSLRARQVFAFEALPPSFDLLVENISANLIENVVPVHAAVSDRCGIVRIPEVAGGNCSLASSADSFTDVQAVTLDYFCESKGISCIDVMKIDIEGSETKALRGCHRLFASGCIRKVVIEFNNYWLRRMGSSPDELYDLFDLYRLNVSILTKTGGTRPISRAECMARLINPTTYFNLVLSP